MGKSKVPPNETDQQKLSRLASARITKALIALRTIAQLAYLEPTLQQRDKAFGALEAELKAAFKAWTEKKTPSASGFTL